MVPLHPRKDGAIRALGAGRIGQNDGTTDFGRD